MYISPDTILIILLIGIVISAFFGTKSMFDDIYPGNRK